MKSSHQANSNAVKPPSHQANGMAVANVKPCTVAIWDTVRASHLLLPSHGQGANQSWLLHEGHDGSEGTKPKKPMPVKAMKATQAMKAMKPVKAMKAMKAMKAKAMKAMEPMKSMKAMKAMKAMETMPSLPKQEKPKPKPWMELPAGASFCLAPSAHRIYSIATTSTRRGPAAPCAAFPGPPAPLQSSALWPWPIHSMFRAASFKSTIATSQAEFFWNPPFTELRVGHTNCTAAMPRTCTSCTPI